MWDWYRLPGTTTERGSYSLKPLNNQRGKTAFVGGASDGMNGVSSYQQNLLNVSANKSWLMFDNAEVALGNSINASAADAGNHVGTNLNQTSLNGPVTYSTAAGSTSTLGAAKTLNPRTCGG